MDIKIVILGNRKVDLSSIKVQQSGRRKIVGIGIKAFNLVMAILKTATIPNNDVK